MTDSNDGAVPVAADVDVAAGVDVVAGRGILGWLWSPESRAVLVTSTLLALTVRLWRFDETGSWLDHTVGMLSGVSATGVLVGLAIPRRKGTAGLRWLRRVRTSAALAFVGVLVFSVFEFVVTIEAFEAIRE